MKKILVCDSDENSYYAVEDFFNLHYKIDYINSFDDLKPIKLVNYHAVICLIDSENQIVDINKHLKYMNILFVGFKNQNVINLISPNSSIHILNTLEPNKYFLNEVDSILYNYELERNEEIKVNSFFKMFHKIKRFFY